MRASLLSLLLIACGVRDRSQYVTSGASSVPSKPALCRPTGRANIDTGVYIGDDGCSTVTLQALTTDAWYLEVGYPMFGSSDSLIFINRTTGDQEREAFYWNDPEFTLYAGNYSLGGLEVMIGDNEIEVYDYPCPTFDCSRASPRDAFSLTVKAGSSALTPSR